MARADKYTLEAKKSELYSDFLNGFNTNPITGLLAKVTNEEAIKQSLKNIILTNVGERFYDSNKGSKVNKSLFDPFDVANLEVIRLQIRECIKSYEPRCDIKDIRLQENLDKNGYNVAIVFSIINIPDDIFSLNLSIQRVR